MSVSEALVAARQSAGLSQKEVAEALGISQSFLSDIEKGRRIFGERHVAALPASMRRIVADAMVAEHKESIARIQEKAAS